MKCVTLSGGLGNQMFQYAFCLALRRRFGGAYVDIAKIRHYHEHNGYELERVFGLRGGRTERCVTRLLDVPVVGRVAKHVLFPHKYRERVLYDYEANAKIFDAEEARRAVRYVGYWQSERYFATVIDDVRRAYAFDEASLNAESRRLLADIEREEAVAVHVRRGDYLLSGNAASFGNICTPTYYRAAMEMVEARVAKPVFYVFSNDMEWCRAHLSEGRRVEFVDCNRGKDSWQDMMLMSRCRHNIVANSSFSWWGAYLNCHAGKMVIAPRRWTHACEAPDAVPEGWTRI